MVRSAGFEPATPRFEVWCSIQLTLRAHGDCQLHSIGAFTGLIKKCGEVFGIGYCDANIAVPVRVRVDARMVRALSFPEDDRIDHRAKIGTGAQDGNR